jgi:hypothetical protein
LSASAAKDSGDVSPGSRRPADAHRLRPDQVGQNTRGDYVVQGYHDPIAAKFALPSADGDYWIFYRDNLDGSRSAVFCFFVPVDF